MAVSMTVCFTGLGSLWRVCFRAHAAAAASLAALAGMAAQNAAARDFTKGAITVAQPWSRATPGGAKVAIGYLVIRNTGALPDRLTGATTDVSEKVSQHTMTMKDGIMTMRPVTEGVVVPGHGVVAFKPGSDHLMLDSLKRPLKKGDSFPGTLTFEKAGAVPVMFDVESVGAEEPSSRDRGPAPQN